MLHRPFNVLVLLTVLLSPEHVSSNKEDDRATLLQFFNVTNGGNWTNNTGWDTDDNFCTWFGVGCDEFGVVTSVELSNNNLAVVDCPGGGAADCNETSSQTSSFSNASALIFGLGNLTLLDLSGNDIPLDFTKLQLGSDKLQSIKLTTTGLRSLDGLSNAVNLTVLHLTNNQLSGSFPADILQLTQLRALYLSFNDLSGSLPTSIGDLSNLEEFYMYGNQITGSLPSDAIAQMTNMREFIMASNYLTGMIPDSFNSLSNLEQLSLYEQKSDTHLVGTVPNFVGAPLLWYFDITGNALAGSIPKDFMNNSNWFDDFVTIYLGNNDLTGTIPSELDAFVSLDLDITGNNITGLPNALCDNAMWMQDQVESFGCDAIACPPGTFNDRGRQVDTDDPCTACVTLVDDNRYGQTNCSDVANEREILEALYNDTGGTNWNDDEAWTTAEPICSWKGVFCQDGSSNDTSGITEINLEENNLIGTISKSLWTLPFLRSFNVKHNTELHLSFDGLSAAKSLELLYLSQARIDTLKGISQASNLRQLHVTDCGISGPFPDELFDLRATLDGLFMAYNVMTGTLPTRFGELTQLESFYAFDNEFSGRIPSEIGMMTNLGRAALAENLLTGPIPSEVSNLLNLQELSIFRRTKPGPKLTGPLPSFNNNSKLSDLYLDHNDITGTIPDDFLNASGVIQQVILSFNRLEGLVPEPLTAFPILNLHLEGNRITAFPPIFCNNSLWMDGAVGNLGCDAFLCPAGTASPIGRANATQPCDACNGASGAKYYGSVSCDPAVRERSILLKFYQACGGTEWYNSSGWATSEPVCNWYGVQCDSGELEKIVALNMGSNNLIGIPTGELFDLPDLESLDFSANPLNGFSFNNIESAKTLTTLRLDSTGVSSLDGIGAAPALTFLDMRFNNLEGGFPEGVLELEHLRYLNLGNNQMIGNLPLTFVSSSRMPYLKTLRLGSNDFSGNVPTFDDSTGLTTIDLSNNTLSGTIADNFLDMKTTSVRIEIDLSGNQLSGKIPVELDRFDYLTLSLRDNQFTDLPDDLCDNNNWNGGDVGEYGCDAILCPPGKFSPLGRAQDDEQCEGCLDDVKYFGQTTCEAPGDSTLIPSASPSSFPSTSTNENPGEPTENPASPSTTNPGEPSQNPTSSSAFILQVSLSGIVASVVVGSVLFC